MGWVEMGWESMGWDGIATFPSECENIIHSGMVIMNDCHNGEHAMVTPALGDHIPCNPIPSCIYFIQTGRVAKLVPLRNVTCPTTDLTTT